MASISLRNVLKSYGENAVVHGVNLEINSGEFVVILGPSGCGKSTLLRMIAGLEEISGGEVRIEDRAVNELEPRDRGCAMVFQNYALYPHMTVEANIGYALRVAGIAAQERRRRVEETASIVGLSSFLDRKPSALSGGQRQRVAMARAMIREPKVFLFDEPLSNLDAKLRGSMRAEIRRLHRQLKATSIFVTHDQHEAMTLADRIIVMNNGRVEQVGTPDDIYHRPETAFVAGFVGTPAMNLMPAVVEADGSISTKRGTRLLQRVGDVQLESGREVTFGIRAEAVSLVEPDVAGAIVGTIDFVEELGATRIIHAEVDGIPFCATTPRNIRLERGTHVGFAFKKHAAHLYSSGDGRKVFEGEPA
ncbi:ABC transporter ATP-binding protein [Rhizobium terrae]|uniref:ABC transporter ATP-binding protein n=1 Tax=Rhizobium terrae TaxID=2171756 RepID=UPI000E3E1EF6|nr:sn-glycerol-3-phosphate ABC transporter ATP-binding protein UgpC [Rhizobium terrae]